MKKITISNFKGIKTLPDLSLTRSHDGCENEVNLLLYAENGGGKTSISEAIRLFHFASNIENEMINPYIVGEEREAAKQDWLNSYLHNKSINLFEIGIDEAKFSSINTSVSPSTYIFVLDRSQLIPTSKIDIEKIISKTHFGGPTPREVLLSPVAIELVLDEVNRMLEYDFKESIRVDRVETTEYIVGVKGIQDEFITENIDKKVNEANQNIIKILIFINYLKLLPQLQDNAKYFIVLDDVMSSLDLANRIILARIIISLGKEHQLLVMTHNVGFYNLIKHLSGTYNTSNDWNYVSLYKFDDNHTIYSIKDDTSVDNLLKDYNGIILPTDLQAVNAMRKKFENLLHEFAKILVIGIQEETSDLIDRICNLEKGYYCYIEGDKIRTHFDLIREISSITNICPTEQLRLKICNLFKKYDNRNLIPWISDTVQRLHTYQKVVLHQGSHDHTGTLAVISRKEIDITLDLMRKLEQVIKRNSTGYPYFI